MSRSLSATVVTFIILTLLSFSHQPGPGVLPWLMAALAAAVCLFGTWCAPIPRPGVPLAGSLFGPRTSADDGAKGSQIVAAALAMGLLVVLDVFNSGGAALVGIVVAIAAGIALGAGRRDRQTDAV